MTAEADMHRRLRRELEEKLDAAEKSFHSVREERDRYLDLLKLIRDDIANLAPELLDPRKP
jgi:hypothetical protein